MRYSTTPFGITPSTTGRSQEGRLLMNPLRNLPVLLREQHDGSILAECPLLPGCSCRALSRIEALRTMQRLLKRVLAAGAAPDLERTRYEVVHVAIKKPVDSGPQRPPRAGSSNTKHAA